MGNAVFATALTFISQTTPSHMRKLIFAINISLDGCCDHTKFNPDEEVLRYFAHLTRDADALLYGRKTYELMVPYWPDVARDQAGDEANNEFARAFVAINKMIVFSRSLDKVEGNNMSIVRANLEGEIVKLKQKQGGNILTGGVSIPSQLMELGLIDEFHFVVHPIVVGAGRRLFEDASLSAQLPLKLVESKTFKSGCVALRYVKH